MAKPEAPAFFTSDTIHNYQNQHISISFTQYKGNETDIGNIKHAVWELKDKFVDAIGVNCFFQKISDQRSELDKQSCSALVSVGLEVGELEIFKIFESKLCDLEAYLFQMKGSKVCLKKGCIKIKAQVVNSADFESLCEDITSGVMLGRICSFLQLNNYQGYRGKPIGLILLVDNYQLQSIREYFIQEKDAGFLFKNIIQPVIRTEDECKQISSAEGNYYDEDLDITISMPNMKSDSIGKGLYE